MKPKKIAREAIGNNGGLYYKSFTGELFPVLFVGTNDEDANAFAEENDKCGVIDQIGDVIIVADEVPVK